MIASRYKIEIEPCSNTDGYYVHVYFPDKWGGWTEMYEYRGMALTYWGARYSAWWRKLKLDHGWVKKTREKETVYEA